MHPLEQPLPHYLSRAVAGHAAIEQAVAGHIATRFEREAAASESG